MSSTIEDRVLSAVSKHIIAWAQQGPEALERFLTYIADDFTGFGTGANDVIKDRDGLRKMTEREQEYLIHPFTCTPAWITIRLLSPSLALSENELNLVVHAEPEPINLCVRSSLVLEERDNQWLIIHGHYSLPDAMQSDADTLMGALQARNEELEREVTRRTSELNRSLEDLKAAQARLIHQEKMASLGTLTAGIAHEVKNPLNFVNNFAELSIELADELEHDLQHGRDVRDLLNDLKRNATLIKHHGQRADSIIRGMMEHASTYKGVRKKMDVNALLEEYLKLAYQGMQAQHEGFMCRIERDYDHSIPPIAVTPREMGRVFLNLLSNAFDALLHSAHPTLALRTALNNDQIEIEIRDNGPGVPEEICTKIFEPFFTTKPTGTGTGLGLSLAYDIVTHGHGGSLTLQDNVKYQGASFKICLPLIFT